uniref:SH2 domain-containing protein n=1 Tax=Rhabditophanes sp. KR3021 TaxID=114890 RepID=A0AC35TIX4_9BILA
MPGECSTQYTTNGSVVSPPTYTVEEDKEGNLFNDLLGVCWPNRPTHGYHCLKEYKERKHKEEKAFLKAAKREKKKDNCDKKNSDDKEIKKQSKKSGKIPQSPISESVNSFASVDCTKSNECLLPPYTYAGCHTRTAIKNLLTKKTLFYLYHERTQDGISLEPSLPLFLAYKSSAGKKYFFPIKKAKQGQWYVDYGTELRSEAYSSLDKLVECLRTYGHIDLHNHSFDMLPIKEIELQYKKNANLLDKN